MNGSHGAAAASNRTRQSSGPSVPKALPSQSQTSLLPVTQQPNPGYFRVSQGMLGNVTDGPAGLGMWSPATPTARSPCATLP